MATTLTDVSRMLDAESVRYHEHDATTLTLVYNTDRYVNPEGEKALLLAIELDEGGAYFKLYAPLAYRPDANLDAFLRACMVVQWETKLIQFEYDRHDGEVRPVIEFALEDAPLTARQLFRCVNGMLALLERYHPTLQRAADEGVVEVEDDTVDRLADFLSGFSPEVLAEALTKADQRMRDGAARGADHDEDA